jgi:hypothetical protein
MTCTDIFYSYHEIRCFFVRNDSCTNNNRDFLAKIPKASILCANKKRFQTLSFETLDYQALRCPEHPHQVLENLQRIYRLKGVIEEHERKWSGIIGNCIKRG